MAALTADAIVDRIRSVCVGLGYIEAQSWSSFVLQPASGIDRAFRVPPPASQVVGGLSDFAEDRVDSFQIWVARKTNADYPTVRRALLRDVHSLTAAVVRDGAVSSGDYHVQDGGRGHSISEDSGQEYCTLRLTLPINYEAQF